MQRTQYLSDNIIDVDVDNVGDLMPRGDYGNENSIEFHQIVSH